MVRGRVIGVGRDLRFVGSCCVGQARPLEGGASRWLGGFGLGLASNPDRNSKVTLALIPIYLSPLPKGSPRQQRKKRVPPT